MKYLIPLLILGACSSAPEKKKPQEPEKVSNAAFKKEKPLTNAQVSDYYQGSPAAKSPALQDETLDRYTEEELKNMNAAGDPLLDISVRCREGDFKGAFQVASQTFNKYQKVAAYWNQVANCHLNSGNSRKALLFYNKALEVSPDYVPALNNIGVMYSRQGQDQKALVAFERASKQGKFSKTPRYNMARLYQTYGLTDSALPVFTSLLSESPQDVDLLNSVASSHFLMGDYNKAMEYYQVIPQGDWRRPEIGLNLSLTLKRLGKTQEAKTVFNNVTEPRNAQLKRYQSTVGSQLGAAE